MSQYSLLIVSRIPVAFHGRVPVTLDLWVRDLRAQLRFVKKLGLMAPIRKLRGQADVFLPEGIELFPFDEYPNPSTISRAVEHFDVVQVAGGVPLWNSRLDFAVVNAARNANKCTILGVSSNRAKTTTMNASGQGILRRARARVVAWSIRDTTERLAGLSDGVFFVGEGLRLRRPHSNEHISIASWITEDDLLSDAGMHEKAAASGGRKLRLCVAARLERMKGTHLAIEALSILKQRMGDTSPCLTIFGEGPERGRLEELVRQSGLCKDVVFGGTRPYPGPFFEALDSQDLLLVTNLNDEQPRVIFDALARGVLPICPDSKPYRALEIDGRLLYSCGEAGKLAERLIQLSQVNSRLELASWAGQFLGRYTIDQMHRHRASWIADTRERLAMPIRNQHAGTSS